ncbi:MAG: GntR family transcriptional regulator [Planctomycetota bacterium]
MNVSLDPTSPVPLYHQLAEALRYGIATGRWKAGQTLPPVRQAAEELGVHLHTVRRAYLELAKDGLVESLGARGTRVTGRSIGEEGQALERTLERWIREAKKRFDLSPDQLSDRIRQHRRQRSAPSAFIVECSESQCRELARQLQASLAIEAKPWSLERSAEPPPGPVIATYFHYNDIRQRWPKRLPDIHFAAIHPDPALIDRIPARDAVTKLSICELDSAKATNIAADLSVIFPKDRFRLEAKLVKRPGELLTPRRRSPVLLAPRVWAQLDERERAHRCAFEVTYVWGEGEARAIGSRFGWQPANALAL